MKRRMRDIVMLFAASLVVVAVSPVSAASRSLRRVAHVNSQLSDGEERQRRYLEGSEHSHDEYDQYYGGDEMENPEYGNNRYENGWYNGANADDAALASDNSSIFYQFEQQVEGDLDHMWNAPPSEWNEEMWEVFGSIILLSIVIVVCFCTIAVASPLTFNSKWL